MRAGGSDIGGVRIHSAVDNSVICEAIDGTDTDDFFYDECSVDGYANMEVYIYAWDCDKGGWAKSFIDHIRFVNEKGISTLTGNLRGHDVESLPPLPTGCKASDLPRGGVEISLDFESDEEDTQLSCPSGWFCYGQAQIRSHLVSETYL